MSEPRLRPQPDALWRTYDMTPFGPGAITSLVRIVDIVPDHLLRCEAVRYRYEYPVEMDRIETLSLDRFVNSHAAPYESEEDWERRSSAGPVRPDEEATTCQHLDLSTVRESGDAGTVVGFTCTGCSELFDVEAAARLIYSHSVEAGRRWRADRAARGEGSAP